MVKDELPPAKRETVFIKRPRKSFVGGFLVQMMRLPQGDRWKSVETKDVLSLIALKSRLLAASKMAVMKAWRRCGSC